MDALVLVREYMHEAPDPDATVVAHGRGRMRITPTWLDAADAPVTVASSPAPVQIASRRQRGRDGSTQSPARRSSLPPVVRLTLGRKHSTSSGRLLVRVAGHL